MYKEKFEIKTPYKSRIYKLVPSQKHIQKYTLQPVNQWPVRLKEAFKTSHNQTHTKSQRERFQCFKEKRWTKTDGISKSKKRKRRVLNSPH
jgi:hypothetical protein